MKTLVLGLGNPILTDDGVGVQIAEAVGQLAPCTSTPIDVSEASIGGLGLLERLVGYQRVILIDAMYPAQHQPGYVHRLSLDDLRDISPTQHSASAHDTSLVTAWAMGQQLDLDLPQQLIIYAVEVENIIDFSEEPTPAVQAAIPQVVRAVLADLAEESPWFHPN